MPLKGVTQRQTATIILAFAAGVAVGANWPKIREALGPLLAIAGAKLGDIYASVAQAIGEQKEAMEDAQAERRHRTRSKRSPEEELLASLATALRKNQKRTTAKRARSRRTGRAPKVRVGTVRATTDGTPEPLRSRAAVE
jgi:Sec-independent protein translocase protein TatA